MRVRPPIVALALLLSVAALAMHWLAVLQVDDVFIVYRYARNLAEGAGLVFNPGEHVEGVTCLLWTVLLAPLHGLGLSLPRVAPLVSAACGLAVLVLICRLHADSEQRTALAWRDLLPALLLAGSPCFLYWSVGALETVPYALLLTLALHAHGREMINPRGRPWSALYLGLAAMTRPETPLVVMAFALDRALQVGNSSRAADARRATLRWLLLLAAVVLPFVLFRHAYYGEWLPNTYYAKLGAPLTQRALLGLQYLQSWSGTLLPPLGVGGWGLTSVAWQAFILVLLTLLLALREPRLRAAGLVALALLAARIFEGGDWMAMWRFVVPALPALALIAGHALLRLATRRGGRVLATAAVVVLLLADAITAHQQRDGGRGMRALAAGHQRAHGEIAQYIAAHAVPGDSIALMDIGLIGWQAARQRVIDISGLTDHDIARAPGPFLDKHYPPSYVLDAKPRFIVLVAGYGPDQRIAADAGFRANYVLLFTRNAQDQLSPPGNYPLALFERRGP